MTRAQQESGVQESGGDGGQASGQASEVGRGVKGLLAHVRERTPSLLTKRSPGTLTAHTVNREEVDV
jgi:hypothetical protein